MTLLNRAPRFASSYASNIRIVQWGVQNLTSPVPVDASFLASELAIINDENRLTSAQARQ